MPKNNKISLLLPMIIMCIICSNINAQISPEVTLGAKYLGDAKFLIFDRKFPVAPELSVGINFNNKWYTGISSYYFGEKDIYDEHKWTARYTSLELEFRRSFHLSFIPKLVPFITMKPGIMLCDFSTEDERYTNTGATLISTSLSAGLYYKLSDKLKISLSPGITRTVSKNRFFNLGDFGTFWDAGITYVF